jgi:hypothetical protein
MKRVGTPHDRFHSYSSVERPELRQFLITNTDLSIRTASPDIVAQQSARDYFAGRDPALDLILGAQGPRRQSP